MPTAAAVAAAAATAKIQAMEAVTNTAAALGLTKEPAQASIPPPTIVAPTLLASVGLGGVPPVSVMPGIITSPQLVSLNYDCMHCLHNTFKICL